MNRAIQLQGAQPAVYAVRLVARGQFKGIVPGQPDKPVDTVPPIDRAPDGGQTSIR